MPDKTFLASVHECAPMLADENILRAFSMEERRDEFGSPRASRVPDPPRTHGGGRGIRAERPEAGADRGTGTRVPSRNTNTHYVRSAYR